MNLRFPSHAHHGRLYLRCDRLAVDIDLNSDLVTSNTVRSSTSHKSLFQHELPNSSKQIHALNQDCEILETPNISNCKYVAKHAVDQSYQDRQLTFLLQI
jgi:hypothetical protein